MAELTSKKKRTTPRMVFKNIWNSRVSYAFAFPYMLVFFIFTVIPVVISIGLSFTSFNMLEMPEFIGMDNYFTLFLEDETFVKAIGNTFIMAAIIGPGGYLLSLLFAWLINDLTPRLRSLVTLIFYAPAISGNIYLIWTVLFSSDTYGYMNGFLLNMGFINQPIQWLKDPKYMMGIVIIVALWSSLSTSFLSFIAGLQNMDVSLYEAAAIEGLRNRWQELWYITLPQMKPQLMFGAVMSITSAFGVGAICTALCGFPSTDYAVHTVMNHLEDYGGMRFEMGYASAIATILFIAMISCNMIIKHFLKKVGT